MVDTHQMDKAGGSVVEYLGLPTPLFSYLQLLLPVDVRRMSKKVTVSAYEVWTPDRRGWEGREEDCVCGGVSLHGAVHEGEETCMVTW